MKIDSSSIQIHQNEETNRFETHIDGYHAFSDYKIRRDQILILHTEVPDALEGNGIAARIAETALNYAREHNLIVLPYCPYFKAYIKKHPEYQDLVKPGFSLEA